MRERRTSGPLESTGSAPVTLPRLGLNDHVIGPIAEAGEQRFQTFVAVVQVNPHGGREAECNVEPFSRWASFALQKGTPQVVSLLAVCHGIHDVEFNGVRRILRGSLHKLRIQIYAQHVDRTLPAR